jgi:hypothetical protein
MFLACHFPRPTKSVLAVDGELRLGPFVIAGQTARCGAALHF